MQWQRHSNKGVMTEGPAPKRDTIKEADCSPVSEDSRFAGESFTKEEPAERDPSPGAVSPEMRSNGGAALHLCSQG